MQNLDYELRCDNLVTPQTPGIGDANTNPDMYRSMAQYRKGLVIVTADLTDGETAVAQLVCATDAAGTSEDDVAGYTVTLTGGTGDTNEVGQIEFDVSALLAIADLHSFVGVTITCTGGADEVAAVLVRGAARWYEGADMPV